MRIIKILIMVLSVGAVCLAVNSVKADVLKGSEIPHLLTSIDQNGDEQSFETVKGEKGAVLYFVRSADWCPYCQVQLLDIRDYGPELIDAGYNVVAISYDAPEKLKAFADRYKFDYTMLSDKNSEIIKAFGILNEDMKEGTPYYGIPHPTIYVVNANGIVQNVFAEEGYKTRPAKESILNAIK